MATIISELGIVCAGIPGYHVQVQAGDMLVTVPTGDGRRQTVKVWTRQRPEDPAPVLRLLSRAAVVRSHTVVRDALRLNAGPGRAAFALDVATNPPALDVVCGLIVDPQALPVNDFLNALHEVATLADRVEEKLTSGADQF
jgi:hypothetical protein